MANTLTFANLTLTDADLYGGVTYIADLNTGEEFSIGNTASTSVQFVTEAQLPLYSKDQTNGVFTWTKDSVSRGTYYITEVTKEGGKYTITAYDAMMLLETSISSLTLTFPLTLSAAATTIATYLGCTVSGTINNGSLSVSKLDDMSIRQLLSYVAEASGCSVKISGSNLCFMYYADSQIAVTASQYKTLEAADYTCSAIDNVTIIDGFGATVATAGAGTNSLFIQGNPFLDAATNTEAQTILSQVSGFVYAPLKCELFEDHGIEIGTIATFGSTATLVMHMESSENGVKVSSVGSDTREEYNKTLDIIATEAYNTAKNTGQYFWHKGSGADPGVHITEIPKDDFLDDPSNGGGNLLATSNGIAVRDGLTELATFGADGVVVGEIDKPHMAMTPTAIEGKDENKARLFNLDMNGSEESVEVDFVLSATYGGSGNSHQLPLVMAYKPSDIGYGNTAYVSAHIEQIVGSLSGIASVTSSCGSNVYVGSTGFTYIYKPNIAITAQQAKLSSISDLITVTFNDNTETYYIYTFTDSVEDTNGVKTLTVSVDWQRDGSSVWAWGIKSTIALKSPSMFFGSFNGEAMPYSTSLGRGLVQSDSNQLVVGKYNAIREEGAFIIGGGDSDDNRINIFAVDWDGNVSASGNVDASGTVLGVLKRVGAIIGEAPSVEPTVPSGTSWQNLRTITLTKGVWMVTIGAEFDGNSAGFRAITLSTGSTSAGTAIRTVRSAPASTGHTGLQATFPVEVTSTSQIFYLNVFQNSGSALTVRPRHTAIKLGNSTST